jgi:hypothetical protein
VLRRTLALVLLVLALTPAAAVADTYCVNAAGCDHPEGSDLQQALDHADVHAGPDTIRMGPNPVDRAGGFAYTASDPIHIEGTGGRRAGTKGTILSDNTGTPTGETLLTVSATGSTVSGLSVKVPNGSGNTGIETNGAISDVLVFPGDASDSPDGVVLDSGAVLGDSDVLVRESSGTGVVLAGSNTTVTDSRIEAATVYATKTGVGAAASGVVRRTRAEFGSTAFFVREGKVDVEDSLLVARLDNTFSPRFGVSLASVRPGTTVSMNHVSLIGPGDTNSTAFRVSAGAAANSGSVVFRNGIVTGFPIAFDRNAGAGRADIATDYSDYGGTTFQSLGTGAITETNHVDVDPGFRSAYDYSLLPGSPLVDAGDPAALASGESATDLDGQPRIADGNGDCSPRRDMGALEIGPGPRAPLAAATVAPARARTGQDVTFDASASCDENGDPLTFSWAFDDGSFSGGATVAHAFTSAGPHLATVTVSDGTGRSSTASVTLVVTVTPAPFRGVTIAKQTVRVSRKGVAKVKVACPKAARGSCAGTLKLGLLGKATRFTIKRGATRAVGAKPPKARLKALRQAKRLTLTATAVSHVGKGGSKTTSGRVTLRAPR